VTGKKTELSPEEMQRLWELYKSGEPMTSITNRFRLKMATVERLCRLAATTIGAEEAMARLTKGDTDATTA